MPGQPNEPGSSSSMGPDASLRHIAAELFLDNKLSAVDISRIAISGQASGAAHMADLAAAGSKGSNPKNLARDILGKLVKGCSLPDIFTFPISGWNHKQNQAEIVELAFLLPHEILASMVNHLQDLVLEETKSPELYLRFWAKCNKLGLCPEKTVMMGMHGDGVPYSKKQSLEVLSFNFLNQPSGDRIPFCAVSKQFICKCGCLGKHTWDDILKVACWSFKSLALGLFPSLDPSNQQLDLKRKMKAGQPLGVSAILGQVRADWPFFKTLFAFPSWSSDMVCWKCKATQYGGMSYRDASGNAGWRHARMSQADFFRF